MKTPKLKATPPELTQAGKTKAQIYGASGVGKTWFTLTFPAPYYIDTEGGADLRHYQERLRLAKGVYLGPEQGSLDFETVIEQMQALATQPHNYKTLIIDSITKLYQTAISNEAERLGEKDAFGASKKPAIAFMRRLVNWAMRLDMNIWFVAHEITEWGTINGQRQEIGKVPDCWDKLVYELDLTLRLVKAGDERLAVVKKSRLTGFQDGDTFPCDYEQFASRYGKDFIEAKSTQIVLATPEQVAEISRLAAVIKLSEEEAEKILNRAGASQWAELSEQQAVKTITWLNNKIKGTE